MEGNRYIGGYLHHPVVRLEALKSLIDDDSNDIDYSTTRDSDSVSTSGISTITPVSMRREKMVELHLVLVNST